GSVGDGIVLRDFRAAHAGEEPDRSSGQQDDQKNDEPGCPTTTAVAVADDGGMGMGIATRGLDFGDAFFSHGDAPRCYEPSPTLPGGGLPRAAEFCAPAGPGPDRGHALRAAWRWGAADLQRWGLRAVRAPPQGSSAISSAIVSSARETIKSVRRRRVARSSEF